MNQPLFSIIIPAFNAEQYIGECITSLQQQTFSDFEVVVVDDGSTDETFSVCQQLFGTLPNYLLIHQDNHGQIAARWNGINHANGLYCMFVDADDKLTSDALQKVAATYNAYKSDIIIFNAYRFWKEGKTLFWPHYRNDCFLMVGNDYDEFKRVALTTCRFNNVWLKAVKRDVILCAKKYEGVDFIRKEEDYLMQLPWYDVATSAVYIPENLYLYRLNPNSVTSAKYYKFAFKTALFIFHATKLYYYKWGIINAENASCSDFLNRVGSAVKQFYQCKDILSTSIKIKCLQEISTNNDFREQYSTYQGTYKSNVGKIALWLVFYKFYRLALFVVEHDPKVHGSAEKISYCD